MRELLLFIIRKLKYLNENFINLNPKTSIILSIILVIFPKIDLIPILDIARN